MQSETSLDMFHSPTGQHDGGASGALILTPESTGQADQFSQSISSSSSWEHRDTPSHISLCSKNALAWLRDRVVPDDEQLLIETLARLSFDVQQKSTLEVSVATVAIPEPDAHTAWEYCEEYFSARADRFFGVVVQQDFESRLRRHFDPTSPSDPDHAWFALRNIVYALGTRLLLSKRGHDPRAIHAHAWRYYEAALSVLTKLLFAACNDLTSIQALALMSFFAENVLSSGVEYMLCSNTVRLAQAAGLHRAEPSPHHGSSAPSTHGNRIWWALYSYEKLISIRDGRPSCINDDDISCPFPQRRHDEDPESFKGFILVIQHAQISSKIYSNLYCATAGRKPEDHGRQVIREELEQALCQWQNLLPSYLRPRVPVRHAAAPQSIHRDSIVYSHYAFYASIIAIHLNFPWTIFAQQLDQDPSMSQYASASQEKVLSAARNIILATRYYDLDINTTGCLVFAYPMLAVTALFVSVMQYPMAPSAQSDVALLDMAAGHFAKLEIATAMQVDVQLVRDIADITRRKINEAKNCACADVDFSTLISIHGSPPKTPEDQATLNLNFMEFISDGAFSIPT